MYCDHCGAPLQPGTAFCTRCGNRLAARGTAKMEGSVVAFILILLLWLLPVAWEFACLIYNILQYREAVPEEFFAPIVQNNVDGFLEQVLLPNGACLLLAVVFALCRVIDVRKIGWRQLLTAVFLLVLCSEGLGLLGNLFVPQLGSVQLVVYSLVQSVVSDYTLNHLWRWIVLLIFLVVVSHERFPVAVILGVSAVGLAAWSAVCLFQLNEVLTANSVEPVLFAPVQNNARLALILIWINRMVMICAALLAGKRILRNGISGLCAGVKIIGMVLFLPVLMFTLGLGLTGAALVEPMVSLMIGFICLVCFIVHKRKNRVAA